MKLIHTLLIIAVIALCPTISQAHYACEADLIEVLFHPDYQMRLRQNQLIAEARAPSANSVKILSSLGSISWERLTRQVTEAQLDTYQKRAEKQLHKPVYNMNNIFYLHLNDGQDVWDITQQLKVLPEIINAYPVPLPKPLPTPNREDYPEYLYS